jgi:hypothetical protein
LELVFPGTPGGGVAAASVGEDQQVAGVGVACAPFLTLPA